MTFLTIEASHAVKVFRSVLDHTLSFIVVLGAIDRHRLESTPAHRENQRVKGLEDSLVPAMLLHTHTYVTHALLLRQDSTYYYGIARVEVFHKLTWNP